MIDFGLHKPMVLGACPTESRSVNVLTSAWYSLLIPNCQSGERAKWVVLSIGQSATPGTPQHIYFMPGYSATDDPASGMEPYCHVLNAFQGPIALDVGGCSYVHVKAVSISGVQVSLSPIEGDGHGVNFGPMRSPPKIIAGSTVSKAVDETASVTQTIPDASGGVSPRYVMITWDDPTVFLLASHAGGQSGWWPVLPKRASPTILHVFGSPRFYFRRAIGSGATRYRVTPLENG